eukprot:gene21477-41542_t
MLLDEPFAGIDPIAVGDIQDLVRHLTNRGIGVLITDHNVRETLDIVDRACIIYGGQVLFAGSPEALVADPNVRRLYLGETPRLDLRQSQSLVMTPQLQQAIKLLALSSMEIEAFIAEEVERNPLLETGTSEIQAESPPDDFTALPTTESGDRSSDDVLGGTDMAASEALDVDFGAETFHHDGVADSVGGADGMLGLSGGNTASSFDGEGPDFDSFAAADISLREHLMAQAGASLSGRLLFLAQQIIEQIEPTGYLGADLLARAHRLGVSMAEMEEALTEVQRFDPTGVGARDL